MVKTNRSNKIVFPFEISFPENSNASDVAEYLTMMEDLQRKYGIKELVPLSQIIEHLDITRVSIERNLLNDDLKTGRKGIRHFEVKGENMPRSRLYIDRYDFLAYLFEYCNLEVTLVEHDEELDVFKIRVYRGTEVPDYIKDKIGRWLVEGKWKSNRQMQEMLKRSRSMVSRLIHIVDSVQFSFPGSQRTFRRFLVHYSEFHYKMLISNYKQMIERVQKG